MRSGGSFFIRRTVGDAAFDDDEGRARLFRFEGVERRAKRRKIVDVVHVENVPAVRCKARFDVFRKSKFRTTFDRDSIGVVDPAEIGELKGSGE